MTSPDTFEQIPVRLGAVNMQATNPETLARFWAIATGGEPRVYDGFVYLEGAPGAFSMFFRPRTAEQRPDETTHLDLTVPRGSREEMVNRLIAAGGTRRWDVLDEHPHVQWTVVADPEGNDLCVAEHPPTR